MGSVNGLLSRAVNGLLSLSRVVNGLLSRAVNGLLSRAVNGLLSRAVNGLQLVLKQSPRSAASFFVLEDMQTAWLQEFFTAHWIDYFFV